MLRDAPTLDGWLVAPAYRVLSPHRYKASNPTRVQDVECLVFHYTASPAKDYNDRQGSDELRLRSWLSGERGKSSTHFIVLRDGTTLQGAPLGDRTWHAGQSAWRDVDGTMREGVNAFSIGIDLENVGELSLRDHEWEDAYGRPYRGPGPVLANSRKATEPYTDDQTAALCALVVKLVETYPHLAPSYREATIRMVGHQHVSPRRKVDPGFAFPWVEVIEAAYSVENIIECVG